MRIDLNSDLGESFGVWQVGADDAMFDLITSANVAAGFHGGDPRSIERAVRLATERGVAIGAHPGYPDLVGFGRRVMQCSVDQIRTDVLYQIGAVAGFCRAAGVALQHVKPHGALSNVATHDATVASAIVAAVRAFDPDLIVLSNPGELLNAAREAGQPVAVEAFADRTYHADGHLTSRSRRDAVITDPEGAAGRMADLLRTGLLPTVDGASLAVVPRSICVHSDSPGAAEVMASVRARLERDGHTPANLRS